MIVKCPACGKPTKFDPSNTTRPFCSERCQMRDLGAWADEQYRVPVRGQESRSVNENPDRDISSEDVPPPKHEMN